MKKILLISFMMMTAFVFESRSQERVISGTITSEDDGSPLPGVNVIVKGTNVGTTSDINGAYKLSVTSGDAVLIFSFIGLATKEVEVGSRTVVDVSMATDVQTLGEVVVTALNIPRDKKSLGYATQQVTQENLRVARETNLNAALAGKIAGVQVIGGSGAKFGAARVRIRGVRGLNSANPLYVVDGMVVNDPSTINMDAVESINVLKGANAAALYGNRARDGVVIITTKTGKKGKLSIDFNNTTTFESVAVLPGYQDEYGGGYSQEWDIFEFDPSRDDPALAALNGARIPEFNADESWGPRMDGSQVAQWDAFIPGTSGYGQTRPWSPNPDNVRDFFETGVFMQNSLSVSKADDNYAINVTFTNSQRTGVLPNSEQDNTFLNLNSSVNLSEKLKLTGIANYSKRETFGNIFEGYNSLGSNFNQWFQRQLDMDLLKRYYRLPDGTFTSWNLNSARNTRPLYWNNPYTEVYANTRENTKEVFVGRFGLAYEVIDGLVLTANLSRSTDQRWGETIIASGTLDLDQYTTFTRNIIEDNYEFIASYKKQLNDDFSISALAGGNIRKGEWYLSDQRTVGGLSVPGLYNLSASRDRPVSRNEKRFQEVRSLFAQASFGYKDILYLDATIRSDWDSTLPESDNAYVYPSVSGSFIFSELIDSQDILSFGKARVSYASVGGELNPYDLFPAYELGNPYGVLPTMTAPNDIVAPDLRAAETSAIEAGIELNFLNNRVRLDFSYFNYDNTNEIVRVGIPGTSGANGYRINSGKTTTKGWDASIGGTPIRTANFNWDVTFNFARSENFLDELYPGLDAFALQNGFRGTSTTGAWGGITAKAEVGKQWGTIVGRKFQRDEAGNIIVDADGEPLWDENQDLGNILPEYTGGIFNRFTYKDFEMSFTIDWQLGGDFYAITKMFNAYSGLGEETVGTNDKGNPMRDPVAEGGGLRFDGVFQDGSVNNKYLEVDDYWKSLFPLHEAWIYDATFVKLREVRFGYTLPNHLLNNLFVKSASVSFVANNLWLIYTDAQGIDPSEISGDTEDARNNGAWVESGNLPPTRTLGFDIRLGF
ncbi:MAG: SusC/RagA family TonB-linked outer membrane protein [Cytophagales bacterium]|nr:SusC/RagA family TonB-linked outer membrane protein [Cytophagales bacterium]